MAILQRFFPEVENPIADNIYYAYIIKDGQHIDLLQPNMNFCNTHVDLSYLHWFKAADIIKENSELCLITTKVHIDYGPLYNVFKKIHTCPLSRIVKIMRKKQIFLTDVRKREESIIKLRNKKSLKL